MPALDELILQCLVIDGRASFRRIARVVGVSEQTVARRVREMQGAGVARVVVRPSGFSADRRAWTVRLRCRPNAGAALAEALISETVGALPDVQHLDLAPYLRRIKQSGSRVVDGRLLAAD